MNDNQTKSQFWREHLEAQKSSGLSIHTWCLENQIPQSQFFYWKRKFNREVPEQPQFAEICFSDQENDMTHEENNYVFRVSYKGMEVAVSSLATVSQITDLITALRRSC